MSTKSNSNNLVFDDGFKEYTLNGDKNRVIRVNPSDPNLIQRYRDAMKNINDAQAQIKDDIELDKNGKVVAADDFDVAADTLKEVDTIIRDNLNHLFNADVYDAVFGLQSPFCVVGKGEYLFEAFMASIKPIIEESSKAANKASEKRTRKYTKGYKK